MEKEIWEEKEEVEGQEEEEATLLVRKPRTENPIESSNLDVEVSNGISENINGHESQSLLPENGTKIEESTLGDEEKAEKLDGVLENEAEITNGKKELKQESETLVFYDRDEGIWKCRICTWRYRNGSVCFDHIQSHRGLLHKLMNFKTLNFETEGVESTLTYSEGKQIEEDSGYEKSGVSSHDVTAPNGFTSAVNNGKDSNLHISEITPLEETTTSDNKSSKEIESADVDELINDDEVEVADLDVEKVLQKQNTHDLYCPNCNSCITRRVILRKRKRRVRVSDEEIKRNKIEARVDSVSGADSVQVLGDRVHHAEEDGGGDTGVLTEHEERERGPDIFRCLSCFSFFIPTEGGFKLFRIFGDKSEKNEVRDEQVPTTKKNWFTSIFASKKPETTPVKEGSRLQTDTGGTDVGLTTSSIDQSGEPSLTLKSQAPAQEPAVVGKVTAGDGDNVVGTTAEKKDATIKQYEESTSGQTMKSKSGEEVEVNGEGGVSIPPPPKRTQITNGESADEAISFSKGKEASDMDSKLNISVTIPHKEQQHVGATILNQSIVENQKANLGSSSSGQVYPNEFQRIVIKDSLDVYTGDSLKVNGVSSIKGASVSQGKDTILNIDEQPAVPTQTAQGTIFPAESTSALQSTTQFSTADRERSERRKELEIEVVKSIVYGGLAESITSLSVVSSAAGGNAATLNIIAIGMANLIGGLFIICHNLWELRSDPTEDVSSQLSNQITERRDRYRELLGRRQNFILHAVVSIISYIIFGLVPPIVYGFSFRKSDDKEHKLVVVAAASLLCISVLAIGRAYVQRPPKPYIKSVTTFVMLGFMVSGVSYAAGILIERILERLGLFQSGSSSPAANLLFPEMMTRDSSWASY